ncbi:MAG: hypothetical protein JOS17DRAFT_779981 [Linnemannia elongata]|nr:MAG: hypothetical protein JOS17DRAFT_779981 [Linnemannia elongata]
MSSSFGTSPFPKDNGDDKISILLDAQPEKMKLKATYKLSKVFGISVPEDAIHFIVQRSPPVHAPVPSRALTPLSGSLSDGPRLSTSLSVRTDHILNITPQRNFGFYRCKGGDRDKDKHKE